MISGKSVTFLLGRSGLSPRLGLQSHRKTPRQTPRSMASAGLVELFTGPGGAAERSQAVLRGTDAIHCTSDRCSQASGGNSAGMVMLRRLWASMLPSVQCARHLAGLHFFSIASRSSAAVFAPACAQQSRMHVGVCRPQTFLRQSAAFKGAQRMTCGLECACVFRSRECINVRTVISTYVMNLEHEYKP